MSTSQKDELEELKRQNNNLSKEVEKFKHLEEIYEIPDDELKKLSISDQELENLKRKYEISNDELNKLKKYEISNDELENLKQKNIISDDEFKNLKPIYKMSDNELKNLRIPDEELKNLKPMYEIFDDELRKLKKKYEILDYELYNLKISDIDLEKLKRMYGIYNIEHTKLDRKNEIVKLKKALNKWQNILNKAYIRSILCLVICSMTLIIGIFLLISYQNAIASGITNVISAIYGAGSFSTLIANLKILYDLYIGSKSDKQDNKKEEISDDLVKKSLKNHPDSLYSKIKFLEAISNNIRNLFTWQTILTIAMSVILFVTSIITALYWVYGSDKFQSANYILIVLSIIGLYESVGFMICINLVILLLVKEKEEDHDEKKEEIIEQIGTIATEEIFKVIEEKEEDHGEKKKVTLEKIEKTKLIEQKEQEVISIIELKEPQIFVVPEPMKINLRLIEVDIKKLKANVENTKNVTDFEVTTAILCQEAGLPNLNTEIYKGNEELFVNVIEQIEKAKVYFHETIILENSITEEVTFFLFFLFFPIAYLSGILSHNQNKKWELKRTIVNDLEIDIINRAISGLSTYPLDAKITHKKKKLPGR